MNRVTGQPLSGWPHVEQSIAVILTTPIGSRVMRREFGSLLMSIIDRPMTPDVILSAYVATAYALALWEPRYRLTGVEFEQPGPRGDLMLALRGEYDGVMRDTTVALAGAQ